MESDNDFHLSSKLADPAKLKATFRWKLGCSFLFCTPIGTIEILQKYEQNRLFQLRRTIMYKERLQHRSVMRRSLLKLILSLSANLQLLRR